MRVPGSVAAALSLFVFLSGISVCTAQQPAAESASADGAASQSLTPLEQREKDVRAYDPLAKPDSADKTDADNSSKTPAATQPVPQTAPLPGSVAASSTTLNPALRRTQGPQVLGDDSEESLSEQYTGPAVLSRSYTLSRPSVPQQIKFLPTLGVAEVFDNGLTSPVASPDGSLQNIGSLGNTFSWGLTGRHFWRRDEIGVQYTGNYNHFNKQSSYNGTNQFLNLDFSHQFTRHWVLTLVETGSSTTQGYGLLNQDVIGGSIADVNLAASPTTQIWDQGMRQFTSMADLTWRKSTRLSLNFGGGYFGVERTGAAFLGNTGYQARADLNYRLTRKLTVGAYYTFTDYTFSRHVEISNANTVGGVLSYAFSRASQLRVRAGVTRAESEGLVTVAIDPTIAALVGRGSTIIDQYHLNALSDISAELVKDFGRTRTANLSYTRGIAPGNGLVMTSTQEIISGSFSTRWMHYYLLSLTAGRSSLAGLTESVGDYKTEYVSSSIARALPHGLSANFGVDYRHFLLSGVPMLHNQLRISTGLTWGPAEGRLW